MENVAVDTFAFLEMGVKMKVGLDRVGVVLVHVADDSRLGGCPFAGVRGV